MGTKTHTLEQTLWVSSVVLYSGRYKRRRLQRMGFPPPCVCVMGVMVIMLCFEWNFLFGRLGAY